MLPKYINSKQKTSEIKDYTLYLGNISKDITINKIKKQDIKGSGFFFVNFSPSDTNEILDFHRYLMKRT